MREIMRKREREREREKLDDSLHFVLSLHQILALLQTLAWDVPPSAPFHGELDNFST